MKYKLPAVGSTTTVHIGTLRLFPTKQILYRQVLGFNFFPHGTDLGISNLLAFSCLAETKTTFQRFYWKARFRFFWKQA